MSATGWGPARTALDRSVVIVGRHSLQNRLLAGLIDERLGCASEVRAIGDVNGTEVAPESLALLDVESVPPRDLGALLQALAGVLSCRHIAVINADRGAGVKDI